MLLPPLIPGEKNGNIMPIQNVDADPINQLRSETILTMGHSKTVEAFLKQAYKDRKFTVVVAESAPS